MTKEEKIAALESRVAILKAELELTEQELEKLKGSGPLMDKFYEQIEASGKNYEEVIDF